MCFNNSIVRSKAFKLVLSRNERQPRQLCYLSGNVFCITLWCVDARTYGSTAKCQLTKMSKAVIDRTKSMVLLGYITTDLLAQRNRCSIHKVRTPDLYHAHKLLRLLC